MKRFRLFLMFVPIAVSSGIASANLLVNGSFETYAVPPANWADFNTIDYNIGAHSLNGWTVIQNVDITGVYSWRSYDGSNSLDLCGTPGNGGVSQAFSTIPGAPYAVRFYLSGNPTPVPAEPTNKTVSVTAAGQSADFSYDVALQQNNFLDMKWRQCDFRFVADSGTTTLAISATMGADFYTGPAIDNVSVVPVPEPSAVGLCVIAAVCWMARRRQVG